MGNELRSVIAADVGRRRVKADELLPHGHHVLGFAAPSDPDGEAEAAVLIDHFQDFETTAISSGVELEIHGSHLMRVLGLMATHSAVCRPGPLLLAGSGALEPFSPPEPVHPLVVHQPPFQAQQAIGHPSVPAGCAQP